MTDVLASAEAGLSVAQRFRIELTRSMRLLDRLWDESKHPRVPAGSPGGGQFGDAGGVAFISPNVGNLDFNGAVAGIDSARQEALRRASADVDVRLGKNPVEATNVVGAWADGAENSLLLTMPKGWSHDESKIALAMKGWLGDQKSALLFTPDPDGNAYIASVRMVGQIDNIHRELLDQGLAFHTLEPTSDGAIVHVYGDDQATADAVDKLAGKHDTEAQFSFGRGEFIGTTKDDGTDREQRDDARRAYDAIIAAAQTGSEFEGRDVGKIWDDLRARWGGELSPQVSDAAVPGRALTSNAIIAEAGEIKSNSRKVQDVAKAVNERAGKILKADLGVDAIDLDNRTEATDDYIAGVIAQELKDGLTNGRSAVDWYDRTMKSAMTTAEKLYPGIASDPDKRFAYTAALAISSQGEVVDSTVRLADQAYKYFAEHGRFPTDIAAADPNIVLNLKKVNAFIDKLGVSGTRDLFSRQMTVRDLKKATGIGVSGMGMDDMVYGSAVLGPKIGQGFYQNLNGNFSPITMDMWFMRAWGRITNTGIGYADMAPQYARLKDALKEDGKKVPRTDAATLKLARAIYAQHEKDYVEHQDEYKSGERKKTEAVFASERIVLNVDGAMVEQPRGVAQRRMITEVFHKALDKLNSEGIRIQPASAQATWWWPEQVLYDKMGARVRENDNDYAKSLKKLADSRGLKAFDYAQGLSFAPWIDDPDPPDYLTDDEIEAMAEQTARYFGVVSSKQLNRDAHSDWMDECVPDLMGYGKDQDVAVAACMNMWRDAWEESHPDGAVDPGPPIPGSDKYDDKQLQIARELLSAATTGDGPMPTVIIDQKADIARSRAWQREKAKAQRLLKEWDESKHPRVPGGESGGHGGEFGEGGGGSAPDIPDAHLDPKVVEVGGDAWNKATAKRLEREYQQAKPKLDAMLGKVEGGGADDVVTSDDEDDSPAEDPPYVPESWEELNANDQEDITQEYYSSKLDSYVDSEKESWYNNGGALDEAKATLAGSDEFIDETLKDYIEGGDDGNKNTDTKFPYTVEQLANAIELDYESDGEGSGDLNVVFNNNALREPTGAPSKEQETLPGIEPEDLSKRLTEKMRDELTKAIEKAFDKKADDTSGDMEAPDYLTDNAKEFMEEDWTNNMSDDQKFAFAKYSTDTINNLAELAEAAGTISAPGGMMGVPDKFDPLNETSGTDYKKTQYLARNLSIKRAEQVMAERGIKFGAGVVPAQALARVDNKLWAAWKSSSTSEEGQLLQVAVADELGGRLNPKTGHGGKVELDKDRIASEAEEEYKFMGGYKGVLAYVRAKWETTQFLLDKAGISELQLYRGIALDPEKFKQAEQEKRFATRQMVGRHAKVPNLNVVRNGAASTTVNPQIANGWSSDSTRVVLRALMPRTAAVSIPAYGINVQSEQEVVVAGTAWKAWDAWINRAPNFVETAMAA